MRETAALNARLGTDALPGSPVQVPIYTFNNEDVNDMLGTDGCPFIIEVEQERDHDPEVWKPYQWMIEQDREPIKAMYGFTDEYINSLSLPHFSTYTDEATDVEFEGTERPHE